MSQATQVKQSDQKVTQVHKGDTQRTVTDYFKGHRSTESDNEAFVEVHSDKKKRKRRRTTGEKVSNKKVYPMDNNNTGPIETQTDNDHKSAQPQSQPQSRPQPQPQSQPSTSPETPDLQYAALEKLFRTKMDTMVNTAITEALEPLMDSIGNLSDKQTELQESIANLTGSGTTLEEHTTSIQKLQQDTTIITTKMEKYEKSQQQLVDKMTQLENKQLEKNLVVSGIPETENEWENIRINKIKELVKPLITADPDSEDNTDETSTVEIITCKRLGKYVEGKTRPMSVEFRSKTEADKIYKKKKNLPKGTYIDREYCAKTERGRRLLRPILKAARRLPEYQGLCKLEADVLVLNGKKYNLHNTDKLPDKLHPATITSKSTDAVHGFFGQLNPLSNFHSTPFFLDGKQFHSSEQYIQYQKALLFDDMNTAKRILVADTALDCKKLGYEVTNFEFKTWKRSAHSVCKPGILAKYLQNEPARITLLKTKNKSIAECTTDKLWGNGIPLHHPDTLNTKKWNGECLLGKLLEECRTEIRALNVTNMEVAD